MKRISQTKFASSLFSCLGVAACVAFSSCGKKDNDQFKNANEFADFLKSKAQERGVSIDDDQLTEFANANWKTASKKTFKFTEEIQNQIAGEDLDNEDEEMTSPDQSNPEQQNPGPEQPKPGTEQPKSATASPAGTETISDEKKLLSELIKAEDGKHAGIKVNDICFDLNVFFEIYSWFEKHKGGSDKNLISSKELKLGEAINMLGKCQTKVRSTFGSGVADKTVDVTYFVNRADCQAWESNTVYDFSAGDIQLDTYNNLLYLLLNGTNLGFSDKNLSGQANIGNSVSMNDAYEALVSLQNS